MKITNATDPRFANSQTWMTSLQIWHTSKDSRLMFKQFSRYFSTFRCALSMICTKCSKVVRQTQKSELLSSSGTVANLYGLEHHLLAPKEKNPQSGNWTRPTTEFIAKPHKNHTELLPSCPCRFAAHWKTILCTVTTMKIFLHNYVFLWWGILLYLPWRKLDVSSCERKKTLNNCSFCSTTFHVQGETKNDN